MVAWWRYQLMFVGRMLTQLILKINLRNFSNIYQKYLSQASFKIWGKTPDMAEL